MKELVGNGKLIIMRIGRARIPEKTGPFGCDASLRQNSLTVCSFTVTSFDDCVSLWGMPFIPVVASYGGGVAAGDGG